jgi:GPI mannosyltransferase 3
MGLLSVLPLSRATIIVLLPKLFQAVFAAFGDYFTWRLAEHTYGRDSATAWTAVCRFPILRRLITDRIDADSCMQLLLTVFNPWQWFCSTRTLSNSLEAVLTVTALNFWPWKLTAGPRGGHKGSINLKTGNTSSQQKQPTSGKSRLFLTSADVGKYENPDQPRILLIQVDSDSALL